MLSPAARWKKLLIWYADHGRSLPWRGPVGDYRVVVSEFMLQQTQVGRVIPLYRRFLKIFPDWKALAAAPQAEVVKAWKGLGYNLRALRLRNLAQTVIARHGGALPADEAALLGLKGIGPYTARALRVFVHRQSALAPDTNVRRVLARLFLGPSNDPRAWDLKRWTGWEKSLPNGAAYDLNQALMDLGATVCKAGVPLCRDCPLRNGCKSYPKILSMPRKALPLQKTAAKERLDGLGIPNRIYRGRIVERLRGRGAPIGRLAELGRKVRDGYGKKHESWLRNVLAGLEKDGLIETAGGVIRLA